MYSFPNHGMEEDEYSVCCLPSLAHSLSLNLFACGISVCLVPLQDCTEGMLVSY